MPGELYHQCGAGHSWAAVGMSPWGGDVALLVLYPQSLVGFLSQSAAGGWGAFLGSGWSGAGFQLLAPASPPLLSHSIEGEYVPVEGDEVTYKVCPIPPKNQKFQAVEVVLTNLAPHTKHETWSGQIIGS